MRVLLASSEVHPYSKTGGLGDMVGALGKALAKAGHQIGIVTPLYAGIFQQFPALRKFDWQMHLPLGAEWVGAEVWTLAPMPNLTIYFIHQPRYYQRRGLYMENGQSYGDNAERFIFFSKAVAHLARYLPWKPQILHLHDWQTGLVPSFVRQQRESEGWTNPPGVVFTIHNLAYQGDFRPETFRLTNLPAHYFSPEGVEFHGWLNCLKAGICHCDLITTVSPRYAREILTESMGCGLDGVLRHHRHRLIGILNGVDYEEWNTQRNPHLKQPYSSRNLAAKEINKLELQKEMGLPPAPGLPLFGNVSRLTDQKGSDLLLGALEEMLAADMQFSFLGSGDPGLEQAFQKLARRYPGKIAVKIGFDQALSHRIEAGCDFFVMPSRFEPCGLNQMYSLRYGTIPIVRRTGGLDDAVIDIKDDLSRANGLKFNLCTVPALSHAIRKAIAIYQTPSLLKRFRLNGMKADFSWDRTSGVYLEAYRNLGGH